MPARVERVDQRHQVLGRAVARGRREVAGRLVAPRAVERVLGERHQLDVGEAEPRDVLDELRRDLAIRQRAVALLAVRAATTRGGPRRSRSARRRAGARRAVRHPRRVASTRSSADHTIEAVPGATSWRTRERIGLRDAVRRRRSRRCRYLYSAPLADAGDRPPAHAAGVADRRQRRGARLPAVEVADHADRLGVRRPHARTARPPASAMRSRACRRGAGACPRASGARRARRTPPARPSPRSSASAPSDSSASSPGAGSRASRGGCRARSRPRRCTSRSGRSRAAARRRLVLGGRSARRPARAASR